MLQNMNWIVYCNLSCAELIFTTQKYIYTFFQTAQKLGGSVKIISRTTSHEYGHKYKLLS